MKKHMKHLKLCKSSLHNNENRLQKVNLIFICIHIEFVITYICKIQYTVAKQSHFLSLKFSSLNCISLIPLEFPIRSSSLL